MALSESTVSILDRKSKNKNYSGKRGDKMFLNFNFKATVDSRAHFGQEGTQIFFCVATKDATSVNETHS